MTRLRYALVAGVALMSPLAANAAIVGSVGTDGSLPILALSQSGLNGGDVASLSGGTVYTQNSSGGLQPVGTVGNFLGVGPVAGDLATLAFNVPTNYVSFLWGTPDPYNSLSIVSTLGGTYDFTLATMKFKGAQYVQFKTDTVGEGIASIRFNSTSNAFETSNFKAGAIAAPGPVAGAGLPALLALGGVMWARRRKQV